jgi:predicted RNA polymerase sigma factor
VFRVSKEDERSRTVITIDGQLSGDHIEIVETCCNQAMQSKKPVHLVLRDVSIVDEPARALLRRLALKGVCVFAKGVYTSYVVQPIGTAPRQP